MSYQKVVRDADRILALLSENRGVFLSRHHRTTGGKPGPIPVLGHGISPETPFESRFFLSFE